MKHTPTPCHSTRDENDNPIIIDNDQYWICDASCDETAIDIVKAVNYHDRLVDELEYATGIFFNGLGKYPTPFILKRMVEIQNFITEIKES